MKRPFHQFLFLILLVASVWPGVSFSKQKTSDQRTYKIGVLAYKGKKDAVKRWNDHALYLNQKLSPLVFEIVPLTYKENELTQAVINRQLDFIITNPGHFTELELGGHVSRLTTRRMVWSEGVLDRFGGTAITLPHRSDLNTYADLSGKTILIPSRSSLGGWQVHLREAIDQGIDFRLDSIINEVKNHKKVVLGVLNGHSDAGFVRSDLIEEMIASGELKLDQLKIINSKNESGYPYLLSTRLYPEWPCGAVSGTSTDLAAKVLRTLLELSPQDQAAQSAHIYGWTVAGNYSTVSDLFRVVGLGPYSPEIPEPKSLSDILHKYWPKFMLLAVVLTLLFSLVLLISMRQVQKANQALRLEIVERKKVEVERERLMSAIEQAAEAIMITDNKGVILYVNPAYEKITGYSKQEALGQKPSIVKSNQQDTSLYQGLWQHITRGKTWTGRLVNRNKNGANFILETSISPVRDEEGIIVNLVAVQRDITHEIALEEQLRLAQKMEVVGLMAGGVAHDLNNMLSGVVSYPELILLDLPEESELRQPLEAIQESGERAATVVSDLLTVARGAAYNRETKNLHRVVNEYLQSPENKTQENFYPNVSLLSDLAAEKPLILCSPVHVKKCLMNLINNASEAIEDEGNIVISSKNIEINEAFSSKHNLKPGHYIRLNVQDSGPGISKDDLGHIFEPFYSKKILGRSGTGLGLTVVWNTMKDHDGAVMVESNDAGTCFQLFFPVSDQLEKATFPEISHKSLEGHNEIILVVDDEPQLRDIASKILSNLGYRVHTVNSGELALKFVRLHPVDLIIMDMLMEPGINGRQTYEEVLKIQPKQKAIIVSGFSESEDVKAAIKLGATGFIKKPYSLLSLGTMVKKALN